MAKNEILRCLCESGISLDMVASEARLDLDHLKNIVLGEIEPTQNEKIAISLVFNTPPNMVFID